MEDAKIDGLSIENAINVIKQKHFKDLTVNDYAFLKAREAYLSEADKRIYLEGEDPLVVLAESGQPRTRAERIINENRPLQEDQRRLKEADEALARASREISLPATLEERTEAQEAEAEARKAKFEELKAGAEALEEEAPEDPERTALEAEANELGVAFNGRTKTETLRKNVEAARK